MRRTKAVHALTAIALSSLLLHASAEPGDAAYPPPSSGAVTILPAPAPDAPNWELPGLHYRDGARWSALVCDRDACALRAVTLRARRITKHPYDGEPVAGQRLEWQGLSLAVHERLLLVARDATSASWLAPRQVETAYRGRQRLARPAGSGTLEARIAWQADFVALVPRRVRSTPAGTDGESGDTLDLQLRSGTTRQVLGTFAFDIEGPRPVPPEHYLLWAGDLDGDGRLDLLVSFGVGTHDVALFLSTRAGPGQAVGEAGRFTYFPIEKAGC